jgi:hypothetical protein
MNAWILPDAGIIPELFTPLFVSLFQTWSRASLEWAKWPVVLMGASKADAIAICKTPGR